MARTKQTPEPTELFEVRSGCVTSVEINGQPTEIVLAAGATVRGDHPALLQRPELFKRLGEPGPTIHTPLG